MDANVKQRIANGPEWIMDEDVRAALNGGGWVCEGDIWGSAAWKQPVPDLVLSIGQDPEDWYMSHPTRFDLGCAVFVYRHVDDPNWNVWNGCAPGVLICNIEKHTFPDLRAAMAFANTVH